MSSSNIPTGMDQQPFQSLRKRARKACESCRKRKRRCDGAQPCRACIEYEYDCYYADQSALSLTSSEPSRSTMLSSRLAATTRKKSPDLESGSLAYGGVAVFPRLVAQAVYNRSIPVRHDFGYNIGMSNLDPSRDPMSESLRSAMSLVAAETFCRKYSSCCDAFFPIIDLEILIEELGKVMATKGSSQTSSETEVAVTFAVLLGSYFSWPLIADQHTTLLLHAEQELENLTFRDLSSNGRWLLRAWILRTLLLRLSSVPDRVWLSSCNMMHVAELSQQGSRHTLARSEDTTVVAPQPDSSLFNLAWVLNQLVSLESGRSATGLTMVDVGESDPSQTIELGHLYRTFQQISELDVTGVGVTAKSCLMQLCRESIGSGNVRDPRGIVIEACVLCGLYRQIFNQDSCLEHKVLLTMKSVFESALTAAETLLETKEPWFMLAEFPSQLLCVCLALQRPLLDLLPRTLSLLGKVTRAFDSGTLKETEKTVSSLIDACLKSRDDDMSILRKSLHCLSAGGISEDLSPREDEEWTRFLNKQIFD